MENIKSINLNMEVLETVEALGGWYWVMAGVVAATAATIVLT